MINLHIILRRFLLLAACLLPLAFTPPAAAHHSFAVHFVGDRTITLQGVVTEFRFTNPHGVLLFTVKDDDGNDVEWRAETNSPNLLRRRGWAKDSLKYGDKITITGFPSRDDDNYIRVNKIIFEDGHELTAQAKAD